MSRERDWEPLSPVDAAWLRMDTPTNAMMITSVLLFEKPLPEDVLVAVLREKLLPYGRFQKRVVDPGLGLVGAGWETDPYFDVRSHVHHVALPASAGPHGLEDLVSDLLSTRLDRARPLWQVHLVDGVGAGCAVVTRLHHAIADGLALVRVLQSLTDEPPVAPPATVGLPTPVAPRSPVALAKERARQAMTLGHLLLLPADAPSIFRGPLGVRKRVAWSSPVPLELVKGIGRSLGSTVNDVLLGCTGGALRAYLGTRAPVREDEELRALVPVAFRDEHDASGLGNHFGLVFVPLPISVADRAERVRTAKRRMDAIKGSSEALVALGVLGAMGVASAELEHVGVDIFSKKATFLLTNVPGPTKEVRIADVKLTDLVVFAPVSGHIGVGFSFLSYAGAVRLGVASDVGLVPDPDAIVAAFEQEIRALS